MKLYRYSALAACSLLLLLLGACDDPSGVGLDVGPRGFEGGEPVTVELEPTTFETTTVDDVTGIFPQILIGTVDDPAVGVTETTGHLDMTLPDNADVPDGFDGASVEKAELVLIPDAESEYIYGDTEQPQQLEVYEIPNDWEDSLRTADEPIEAGTRIGQSETFVPGDTVTIELSSDWAEFQSLSDTTNFDDIFHGFQLRAVDGNTVVRYDLIDEESHLEVSTEAGAVKYRAARGFTAIERLEDHTPEDRLLVQDGTGQALSFSFTLPDSLQNAPISRAELYLPIDTTLFDEDALPDDFVRPRTEHLNLEGLIDGEQAFDETNLSFNGTFRFDGSNEVSLRQIFQRITLDESSIEQYRITTGQSGDVFFEESENTINPLLFYTPDAEENAPRVLLTVTRSDD